jgi:hypothetical protein
MHEDVGHSIGVYTQLYAIYRRRDDFHSDIHPLTFSQINFGFNPSSPRFFNAPNTYTAIPTVRI